MIYPDDDKLIEFLNWVKEQHFRPPLFDFAKHIGHWCENCHYPFDASSPGPMKSIDCPIHRPAELKYADKKAGCLP